MRKNKQIFIELKSADPLEVISYTNELMRLQKGMYKDYLIALKEFYKEHKSYLVGDASPIDQLEDIINRIGEKWFDAFAQKSFYISRRAMINAAKSSSKRFADIKRHYPMLVPPEAIPLLGVAFPESIPTQPKTSPPLLPKTEKILPELKKDIFEPIYKNYNSLGEHYELSNSSNPFLINPDIPLRVKKVRLIEAGIKENVSLIKTIPKQFHDKILESVMRNIAVGGNAQKLVQELSLISDRSAKRIKFIANDQLAKATALLDQQEAIDTGFTQAIWQKSIAGKTHRKTHAEANGKVFDIRKGCLIEGEYILPRIKPNCKCYMKLILARS